MHRTPTPRLGGIAMYIGVIVSLLAAWFLFPSIAGTDYFRLVFSEPGRVLAVLGERPSSWSSVSRTTSGTSTG